VLLGEEIAVFGELGRMLKQLGSVKAEAAKMKESLQALTVRGTAGDGAVEAVVDGYGIVKEITIAPEMVEAGDCELLQDAVVAAVSQAQTVAAEAQRQHAEALTEPLGISLDGLSGMLKE